MPLPHQKKAKTADASDSDSLVASSESNKEGSADNLSDNSEDSEEDGIISISSDIASDSDINKSIVLNAHPSPPPTIQKRKCGRKPKSSEVVVIDEANIIGSIL